MSALHVMYKLMFCFKTIRTKRTDIDNALNAIVGVSPKAGTGTILFVTFFTRRHLDEEFSLTSRISADLELGL